MGSRACLARLPRAKMKSGLVCPTPGPRSHPAVSVPLRQPMGGPLTLLAMLWALGASRAQALRIGAFNIQSFGDSKVSDPGCGGVIAQVRLGARGGVAAGLLGLICGSPDPAPAGSSPRSWLVMMSCSCRRCEIPT